MGTTFLKHKATIRWYGLLCVGTFIALIAVWSLYGLFRWYTIAHEKKHLQQIGEKEEQRISRFFNERMQEVTQLTQDKAVVDYFQNPQDSQQQEALHTMLAAWRQAKPYTNLLILDLQGILIFSQAYREEQGLSVINGMFGNTVLSAVVKQVLQNNKAAISDISYYPGELHPTQFIAVPYMVENKLHAVIVAQLADTVLFELVQANVSDDKALRVVLAKQTDDHALLITPLPDDPRIGLLHMLPLDDKRAYAYKEAFAGHTGTGVTQDYYSHTIIAAWQPIPVLNWALRVAVSEESLFYATRWLLDALVTITLVLVTALGAAALFMLVWWWLLTHASILLFLQGKTGRTVIALLFLIATASTLFLANSYIHLLWWRSYALQNEIKMKGQYAVQQITHHFFKIEDMADTLCYTLGNMPVAANKGVEIQNLITQSLQKNPSVLGIYIAYNPAVMAEHTLFAPFGVRKEDNIETGMIQTIYDYTKPNGKDLPDTSWYHSALDARERQWVNPFFDKIANTLAISISTPFYAMTDTQKTTPLGVVAVLYGLHEIKDLILSLGISGAGYSLLISPNGSFIYHPNGSLVLDRATIYDLAKESKQPLFATIGKDATAGKRGLMPLNYRWWGSKALYAYYQHIPLTNWSLIMVFIADESLRAVREIHHVFMRLTVSIVLSLLLLILLLVFSITMTQQRFIIALALYTLVLLVGMFAILGESRQALVTSFPGETIITDSISMRRFMDKFDETIMQRHESPPLQIKTGLLINLIDFTTFGAVKFSGYVWQDYPLDVYKTTELGVNFPQAQEIKKNSKTYEYQYGNVKIIGWEINGQLVQRQRYARYPFDESRVEIIMEPADETKNILLVPDLQSYRLVNPSSKPAFNSEFLYSGFAIEKSFFSFRSYTPDTNLGMPNYLKATQRVHLVYNILSLRSWLHSFIVFFLPLTVIMFLLFALLFILESSAEALHSPVKVITAASSLFFSTLVGHQLFRQQFQLSAVTYIEYFFFLSYVTIALLIIYTSLLIQRKVIKPRKRFCFWFWPLQSTAWFIITAIIFY